MADKELVLELGVEGGGASVFRTPHAADGWQFHVEGTSMYLDEIDDEGWRCWTSQPVLTVEEALRAVAEHASWVFFYPVTVHPDCRVRPTAS
jgi:hypothetical protein